MSGEKEPVRFLITGAAGQIGYSLIPIVASGRVLGPDQPVILHLLDIAPMAKVLNGVAMEVDDCAYPLVRGIVATTEPEEGFKGVNFAALVGGFPRRAGMLRKDLLGKNSPIFVGMGKALNDFASKDVKVVVVANPANSNCLVAMTNAPDLPKTSFSALTRLDYNRARAQLAAKIGCNNAAVKNVTIWGNHSSTMYPDASTAIAEVDGKVSKVTDLVDEKWLQEEFVPIVQKRGASVIKARGLSSAMSAANAVADHMRTWVMGTEEGQVVSMAVCSDGSYGITEGLIYSFPVTCSNGEYSIVQGLDISEFSQEKMKITEKELLEERAECNL